MCQIRILLEDKGEQKKIMEDVTKLEITSEGIVISSFFDEPKLVSGVEVKEIDFLSSTAILSTVTEKEN